MGLRDIKDKYISAVYCKTHKLDKAKVIYSAKQDEFYLLSNYSFLDGGYPGIVGYYGKKEFKYAYCIYNLAVFTDIKILEESSIYELWI